MNYFLGLFYLLHGLVHLLYLGHSLRFFELEKGFIWPDHAILIPKKISLQRKQQIAAILCFMATLGFAVSGICLMSGFFFHNLDVIFSTGISSLLFIVFWDGRRSKIHTQGGIALIINLLILVLTLNKAL